MSTEYKFQEQLSVGSEGEQWFLENFKVEKADGYKFDFYTTKEGCEGKTVELKTDTYDTGNFFFEYLSDSSRNTPGGPWRAHNDSVDYFVYYFSTRGEVYWFETEKLWSFLDTNRANFDEKSIKNTSWTTKGYVVPIGLVAELAEEVISLKD